MTPLRIAALLLLVPLASAGSHEDPLVSAANIVATAQATPDLSGLVTALTLPGQAAVLAALQGAGPFTVFAPTNGGFEALKTLKNADGVSLYDFVTQPANSAVLTKILQYHVLGGEVKAGAFILEAHQNAELETLLGEKVKLTMKDSVSLREEGKREEGKPILGELRVDSSKIIREKDTEYPVLASNGVVYLIDNVLVPPSLRATVATFKAAAVGPNIVATAEATPDLSELVTVLKQKNYVNEAPVLEALQGAGPFTVFAPTNGAWEYLKNTKNTQGGPGRTFYEYITMKENHSMLKMILEYHVLSGEVKAAAAIENAGNNAEVATLLKNDGKFYKPAPVGGYEKVKLTMKDGSVMVEGVRSVAKVTATDVMASNGVVHLIDNVLIPPMYREYCCGAGSFYEAEASSASTLAVFSGAMLSVVAALCW